MCSLSVLLFRPYPSDAEEVLDNMVRMTTTLVCVAEGLFEETIVADEEERLTTNLQPGKKKFRWGQPPALKGKGQGISTEDLDIGHRRLKKRGYASV